MSLINFSTLDRYDSTGKIRFMTRSGGYVMCRRPRAIPFVLSEKQWMKLSPVPIEPSGATANGE